MNILFLTQVTGILKPFAWIMGVILDAIYKFVGLFGIHNLALCIFLFTFVVKMLMLPLTIKQQKFTRLSSKMNPELTKIQEKYKGKKDEESMRRQQAETQEVYAKYGTNPMGGCLPLLISLPIMFALYRVIYAIPAYVGEVGQWYGTVADAVIGSGNVDAVTTFVTENGLRVTNNLATYAVGSAEYRNSLIDILAKFSTLNWDAFFQTSSFAGIKETCSEAVTSIIKANNLFGLNILDTPNFKIIWSLIIPVLAVVTQMIQTKLMSTNQPQKQTKNNDNPMANSMQSMNTIMPIMSGVFCLMLPIGVGIYWIASALFTILQTIFINRYLDKTDLDEMIAKNVEKATKRKEKLGVVYDNKMAEVAKKSTKSYENPVYDNTSYKKNNKRKSVSGSDYQRSSVSYSAKSIAANANLLRAHTDNGTDIKLDVNIDTKKDNKGTAEEGSEE